MADESKPAGKPESNSASPASEATGRVRRRPHWIWPLGLAMAGIGSTAAFVLRGCWHAHMTWPIRYDEEFSYQVCPSCGIKRLFDEKAFHAYGPYGYDVKELIARERTARIRRLRRHEELLKARAKKEPEKTG
jgi:DNA-directed RNA polymerase subunit RPC12/RpoP